MEYFSTKKTNLGLNHEFLRELRITLRLKSISFFILRTYEELLARHTIPDYLYQSDEDDLTHIPDEISKTDNCETISNGNTNPFKKYNSSNKEKSRRRSIHKYIREQQSIDDDIGIISSINGLTLFKVGPNEYNFVPKFFLTENPQFVTPRGHC